MSLFHLSTGIPQTGQLLTVVLHPLTLCIVLLVFSLTTQYYYASDNIIILKYLNVIYINNNLLLIDHNVTPLLKMTPLFRAPCFSLVFFFVPGYL